MTLSSLHLGHTCKNLQCILHTNVLGKAMAVLADANLDQVREDLNVELNAVTDLGKSNGWVYAYFLNFLKSWRLATELVLDHQGVDAFIVVIINLQSDATLCYSLNISVVATNPGYMGKPRMVYCEVFLHLEACKSCRASVIELYTTTFRKSVLQKCFLALLFLSGKKK